VPRSGHDHGGEQDRQALHHHRGEAERVGPIAHVVFDLGQSDRAGDEERREAEQAHCSGREPHQRRVEHE
jgi:hypothetical protein